MVFVSASIRRTWALAGFLAATSFPALSRAIIATSGSPCYSTCGGNRTGANELICIDSDYNMTAAGINMKNCLLCESTSTTYDSYTDNDVYWFIFNQKYTIQTCVYTNSPSISLDPCQDQCEQLSSIYLNLWWATGTWPNVPLYDYCTENNNAFLTYVDGCSSCLRNKTGSVVLGNFMDNMASACKTQPNATMGQTVTLPRPLFDMSVNTSTTATASSTTSTASSSTTASTTASTTSTTAGGSTTGSPTTTSSSSSSSGSSSSLAPGAAAGIGVGSGAAVIIIGGLIWFFLRRNRRNPQYEQTVLSSPQQPVQPVQPVPWAEAYKNQPLAQLPDQKEPVELAGST